MSKVESIIVADTCYHCGENVENNRHTFDDYRFCCKGCLTVYEILKDNNLCSYYDLNENAGLSLKSKNHHGKYDFLISEEVQDKLIDFRSAELVKVSLYIPSVHCSSCVWLLENFAKITKGVFHARLNFIKKTLSISYNPKENSLKDIVELLSTLGYEPYISFETDTKEVKTQKTNHRLLKQIAVVGFCMGNIMLLSFPEYFGIAGQNPSYSRFFLYLIILLSLPVYFYGGWDYLAGTVRNLKSLLKKETEVVSIDLPIALSITALFIRSSVDSLLYQSSSYWDSLAGLVFFLLVGKWVQKKTFDFLTFERTFKSYFPLAVFVKNRSRYENISDLKQSDTIICKNDEVIPADGIIKNGLGKIDYSFVTGESQNVLVAAGEAVFAGGKQTSGSIEVKVTKTVDNSYLTQLWNDASFKKGSQEYGSKLSQHFIKFFTLITLAIATLSGVYWYFYDVSLLWTTVTAVLMVACPCALTLSMPFTMGAVMSILGKNKFFVRSQEVIQELNEIDEVVFDKTGTLTSSREQKVNFVSYSKTYSKAYLQQLAYSLSSQSSHPKSRAIASFTKSSKEMISTKHFREHTGAGLEGELDGYYVQLGSRKLVNHSDGSNKPVYLAVNGEVVGSFTIKSPLREGVQNTIGTLNQKKGIHLLSGDNDETQELFRPIFGSKMHFNQKPEDKLLFIKKKKMAGSKVLMIGDGLNDAGALQESHVGIVVSEDTNRFSPACDAIIEASAFKNFTEYLSFCRLSLNLVKLSFLVSLVYNVVGISWAVSGKLSPLLAAILMPLSNISVVLLAVGGTYLAANFKNLLKT